ncbi:alcohol dehydrogenase catalytic domain-containing protein [Paraburkholderia azotifigens]|uniref:Alcohol dehydrogenase catalytic domain-containing protein n=1 Tax=Paraburkholderia azotifigens TaxID=2057004 RepID=A0ABU9RDP0_9BURK
MLRPESVAVGETGSGEIRIAHRAVGVNFHDIYVRTGLYRTLPLPGVPGLEAVGVVVQLGRGVEGLEVGDRVAYVCDKYGTYATERVFPSALFVNGPPPTTGGGLACSPLA